MSDLFEAVPVIRDEDSSYSIAEIVPYLPSTTAVCFKLERE